MRLIPAVFVCLFVLIWTHAAQSAVDARGVGLKGDGVTDDTAALQAALGEGNVEIVLPPGVYLLGTVKIPSNVTLRGEPGTKIRINPAGVTTKDGTPANKSNGLCLFVVEGSHVKLEQLEFDFTLMDADDVLPKTRPGALIVGENIEDATLSRLVAERAEPVPPIPVAERRMTGVGAGRYPPFPSNKTSPNLANFTLCRDLVMKECRAKFMFVMLDLKGCGRIWSLNNRAEDCYSITRARGGDEFLWHMGNWSRSVTHQCRWWGGNANDRRNLKEGDIGWGTATTVTRGVPKDDPAYNPYTVGAFDVFVVNNYADYGQTLAWGAKGRHIVFQGNIGRFMTDYVMGSEGGEDVVFKGNITINGHTSGLASLYWGDKMVMSGNIVLVRDEPIDMQYSTYATQTPYQGGLILLHAAGAPTKSGAGQTLISDNLLVNEMQDRPRGVSIQASRDIMITGNKIRNGVIRTKGGTGQVTVTNNDFLMTLSTSGAWVNLNARMQQAMVRGNNFRSTVAVDRRSPTEMLILAEADGSKTMSRLRVIEGNQMEGFPVAIWARGFSKTEPDRFLIRNNSMDGEIRLEGLESAMRMYVENNFSLQTLGKAMVQRLDGVPNPLPEAAPAPDEGNAEESAGANAGSSE